MVVGLLVMLLTGYAGAADAAVNHLLRTYSTAHPGLTVDTVGGSVQVDLRYDHGAWVVGPAGSGLDGATTAGGLTFQRRCAEYGTPVITSITRDGTYVYALPEEHVRIRPEYDATGNLLRQTCAYAGDQIYYHRPNSLAYLIRKTADGYRWADKYGEGHLVASYYYDPFGRRLWKEVNGVRTYFGYADEGLIGEYDANGNVLRAYGYRPDASWSTNPLFLKQGNVYYFYQNDHSGTPQKLIAQNGAVVWSATYKAFGQAEIAPVAAISNNLRFPGQYEDVETGLYYNYHRYYDPTIGRYLQADPIGLKGGSNLFAYSDNNPLMYRDILGLQPSDSSPVAPTTQFTGCCGPDVTDVLNGALTQARQLFDDKPTRDLYEKWQVCTGLLGIDASIIRTIPKTSEELTSLFSVPLDETEASSAWDTDLWSVGQENQTPTTVWNNAINVGKIRDGTGEPECEHAVAYEGGCFHGN